MGNEQKLHLWAPLRNCQE